VAPEGHENLVTLIPVASGLKDNPEKEEYYFKNILNRIYQYTGTDISNNIVFKKSYTVSDFTKDYYSFKGNAYGLANTLLQTATLKPSMLNKKVKNLVYAGQLTVPGPGVPPSLISGKIAANLVQQKLKI
jgi:phytoene desaturase